MAPQEDTCRCVSIELSAPGVSPESIERRFLVPIERRLMFVEGVRSITAIASEGSGRVEVQPEPTADAATVLVDVEEAVRHIEPCLPQAARTLVELIDDDSLTECG